MERRGSASRSSALAASDSARGTLRSLRSRRRTRWKRASWPAFHVTALKGEGTDNAYFPRLAGKPAGYLANQLHRFPHRAAALPADELPARLSSRRLPETDRGIFRRAAASAANAGGSCGQQRRARAGRVHRYAWRRGQQTYPPVRAATARISRGWSPQFQAFWACARRYISAQLGAWRYGTRTAAEPDCMQIVAGHLTEDDVKAIAAFLAAQPAPADLVARSPGTFILPFACGSEPQ